MPNLKEFFKKEKLDMQHSTLEHIEGMKPCSKCDEDVDGGLWDPVKLELTWTCSKGHANSFKVN